MKIEKQYLKNYIVHGISILDLEMLNQLLKPIPKTIKDKIEISSYLHDFEVIFLIKNHRNYINWLIKISRYLCLI